MPNKYKYQTKSAQQKEWLKPYKEKFNGFKFEFNDDILIVEVKLPFNIVKVVSGVRHCDEDKIYELQKELRKRISQVEEEKHLIILDCHYVQIYLSNVGHLDEICTLTKEFIQQQIEVFGRKTIRGRKTNKDF